MPIRLNLLAETQAIEDERRRDPVKRTLWIAALLVALMLGWASSLQLKALLANQRLNSVTAKIQSLQPEFKKVTQAQAAIAEGNRRLRLLHSLSTNRFLYGSFLNALQQVAEEDVQFSQVRVAQAYSAFEGTKPKTNASGVVPGKPPTATESITLSFDGVDSSASPGDEVTKFKERLAAAPYFAALLGRSNQVSLKSLSAPTVAPESGRAVVLFALESQVPPRTR